jgi:hypothetical protein
MLTENAGLTRTRPTETSVNQPIEFDRILREMIAPGTSTR